MPQKRLIEFIGESGTTLRGWLFTPEGNAPPETGFPAISMCHGFAAVKEHRLEPFALAFCQAGFVVLVHDHRNFGDSDGEPRHDIDPWAQVADWRRAISYLETLEEVDGRRIGIWGTSFSGGHALVLAATDRRVRCIVSQVPTISGFEQSRRRVSPDAAPGFLETLSNDLRDQHKGHAPVYQAVVHADPAQPAAYRSSDAVSFYQHDLGEAAWKNTVTLRSTFAARMYEPGIWAARISPTPLLMVVATDDHLTMTDLELQAYENALQPKQLTLIPGGHFDPYGNAFPLACSAATQWFSRYLLS
jgi:fermentation-respiration switch protein FrsA (DUF1100 family)